MFRRSVFSRFGSKVRSSLAGMLIGSMLMGVVGAPVQAGPTSGNNPSNTSPNDSTTPPCSGGAGCPQASVSLALVSIRVSDRPVGYTPPLGPAVSLHLTYNQLDTAQPANPTYSNVGPLWTTDWLGFITDNPQNIGQSVTIALPGGGSRTYTGYTANGAGGTYAPEERTGAILTVVSSSPIIYERRFPDGSKEVYAQSDGSTGSSRHVFLSKTVDPYGNPLTFGYDAKLRLATVTDAIGQVTTLQYTNAANPLLITGVTDPFGRKASLGYDAGGHLTSLGDAVGMHSTFAYDAANNLTAMTTPYGATTFTTWVDPNGSNHRYVEMTDPLHHTTHVEFVHGAPGIPFSENLTPSGMNLFNAYVNYRNTFVWDGAAFAHAKGDYTQAMIYHWLHEQNTSITSGVLESTKAPLANRMWYNYPGQGWPGAVGTLDKPSLIGRVLPDGSTQLTTISYNAAANPTSVTDPIGRRTNTVYDAVTGIDPISETQKTATGTDTLNTLSYNAQHEPLSLQNASGSTTVLTYNAKGQPLTVKNALGQVTSLTYDPKGYLTTVTDANQKTLETFTYDSVGRVASHTDSEGWTIRYQYDNLDRVVKETYPDGTSTTTVWDKLDIGSVTDRLGRTTTYAHDAARNLASETDPLGRVTKYAYDEANRLVSLTDPMGNVTAWTRDIEGRVVAKTYPDGTATTYAYDTAGRLATRTDALGQVTTYAYAVDNRLTGVTYAHAVNPTPNVAFTWDPFYPRLISMTGGTGTTQYGYVPVGSPGALQRQSEIGPDGLPDTVTYAYDALGRVTNETIAGQPETFAYDAIGRVIENRNVLGRFTERYLGETNQLTNEALTGSVLSATYAYEPNIGDRRLKSILHNTLHLTYSTDDEGNALTQRGTQIDEAYAYDAANRLVRVSNGQDCEHEESSSFLGRSVSDECENEHHSSLAAQSISGGRRFAWGRIRQEDETGGNTSSSATYTYDAADNLVAATGAGAFSAKANALDQLAQVTTKGSTAQWSYDKAGNLLSDGVRTYAWDAENRLLSVTVNASHTTSIFAYDPLGRRVAITDNGSTKRYRWCDENICAARNVTGSVTARYFSQGEINGVAGRYYATDRLGSVRKMTDQTGVFKGSATYDAYGRTTTIGEVPTFAYAGMFYHKASGLYLTQYRAYAPEVGRWISRDPIGEIAGTNLYAYVNGNPMNGLDPLGLCKVEIRYNKIGHVPGAGDYYHSYVVTTDPSGAQTYYRAGPSGGGPSGGSSGQLSSGSSGSGSASSGGSSSSGSSGSGNSTSPGGTPNAGGNADPWGRIQSESGPYIPGTIDWNPNPTPSQVLEDDDSPCACGGAMQNYVNKVNTSNIPYNPFNTNSNAFATGAAKAGGFKPNPPPVWTPGYDTTLPVH